MPDPWEARVRRSVVGALFAGMQAAGPSVATLVVAIRLSKHDSVDGGHALLAWIATSALSAVLVAWRGYREPSPGVGAFLGRLVGAVLVGGMLLFLTVVLADKLPRSLGDTGVQGTLLTLAGALWILGRRWSGAGTARGTPVVIPMILVLGLGAAFVAAPSWLATTMRALWDAPSRVALPLGVAFGLGAALVAAGSRRLRARPEATPWVIAAVPGAVALVGAFVCAREYGIAVVARAAGAHAPVDSVAASAFDRLADGARMAAALLLLAGILAGAAALGLGARGRGSVATPEAEAMGRRTALVGVVSLVVALVVGHVPANAAHGGVGWMPALPAAAGIAGLCLAAPADAIAAGALGAAGVLLFSWAHAFGEGLPAEVFTGPLAPSLQAAEAFAGALGPAAAGGLVFYLALLATAAVAVLPGALRDASRRSGPPAVLTLFAPALSLVVLQRGIRATAAGVGELWTSRVPSGVSLPAVYPFTTSDCEDLDPGAVLFVGDRVTLGPRDLGAASVLDTADGCDSVARATDVEAKRALRLGLDTSVSGARVECLVRALGSSTSRDPVTSRLARRRPRCSFDWLGVAAGQTSFPRCVPGSVVADECPSPTPQGHSIAVLSRREVAMWTEIGPRKMDPPVLIDPAVPLDRVAWPSLTANGRATWVGLQPDATAGQLVALEAVQQDILASSPLTQPILPSALPPPMPAELPAPPEGDPFVSVFDWSTYDGVNTWGDALGKTAIRCEMMRASFLGKEPGSTWASFLVAVDGAGHPQRIWSIQGDKDPAVRGCVARAVLDAVIPGPGNRVTSVEVDPSSHHAAVRVTCDRSSLALPYADGSAIDRSFAVRADAILSTCYAPMLRADRRARASATLDVRVVGGALTSVQVTDASDPAPGACAAHALTGAELPPTSKPPPAHFVVEVSMTPAY